MICKNCEYNFKGNFCSNCGQDAKVQRVNLGYLQKEIVNSVFQVNRGILYTLKELFVRPGHSIREFLNGKRKRHFKPLAFVLLVSTVYVLLTYFAGTKTYLGDALSGMADGFNTYGESRETSDNDKKVTTISWFFKKMANNHAFTTLLLLPFFSLASYTAFWKTKYNYFEHFILNSYIVGQQMVIYLIVLLPYSFLNPNNYFVAFSPIFIGFLFTLWTFIQFFDSKNLFSKVVLTLLTYFYYVLLLGLMIFLGLLCASLYN